jgi:hypothetical protein
MKSTKTIVPSPQYFDLKSLAIYASCSIRWLRDRLVDRSHPLPHFRIAGKLLVKREDFEAWISAYRVGSASTDLQHIVDSVLEQVTRPSRVA